MRIRHRRGAALVAAAVFLGALLAFSAIGMDLGRLAFTATEVQAVADAAAIGGARTLLENERDGGARDAVADAMTVAFQNVVDGEPAALAADAVVLGNFDFERGVFVPGGTPENAVRVTHAVTVENLMASILGSPTSTVTRAATAVFAGASAGYPTLPIAVGDCKFRAFQDSGDCSDLPKLTLAPDPDDNSGWTSLSAEAASASEAMRFLPAACGGGGLDAPAVQVGQNVNVMNGSATTILQAVESCEQQGMNKFMIPIVACGGRTRFNQAMEVLGFATIEISSVATQGGRKGINLSAICETTPGMGAGPGNFGTTTVALVG